MYKFVTSGSLGVSPSPNGSPGKPATSANTLITPLDYTRKFMKSIYRRVVEFIGF